MIFKVDRDTSSLHINVNQKRGNFLQKNNAMSGIF